MKPFRFLMLWCAVALAATMAYVLAYASLLDSPIQAEHWLRDVRTVKRALARQAIGPKVVLAGGSHVLFGADARAMSVQLGRPVLNLGLHAELPVRELLEIADRNLGAGDVALVMLEFERYREGHAGSQWHARQVLAWDREAYDSGDLRVRAGLMLSTTSDLVRDAVIAKLFDNRVLADHPGRRARTETEVLDEFARRATWAAGDTAPRSAAIYDFRNLDGHGDILRAVGSDAMPDHDYGLGAPLDPDSRTWRELVAFEQSCRRKGARCVFALPPVRDCALVRGKRDEILRGLDDIAAHGATLGLAFLPHREAPVLDAMYYFDTRYHLNEQGRTLRTSLLMAQLRPWL